MSITFTDQLDKPSEITTIPNQLLRPVFGASYGFDSTAVAPAFNDSLTFPIIEVFDNESDFINDTGADDYTIVYAKDTDRLYVWESSEQRWYIYEEDSSV